MTRDTVAVAAILAILLVTHLAGDVDEAAPANGVPPQRRRT